MATTPFSRFSIRLLAVLLLFICKHQADAQQPKKTSSEVSANSLESLGFSSERLERLHAMMQREVDEQQLAGLVTILARHGKTVEERTYGKRNIASGAPMTMDTIFRIFSMTKPVTGVAMMVLYEDGKWAPSDPISKYIPEFAHLKVFKGMDQHGNMILEDPIHPPTMRELLTHTAGFTYGFFDTTPVGKMYLDQEVLQSRSLQAMINKLARIPLLYQPGTRWVYSISTDIQGEIIEKLSGQSLPDFMQQRIFGPLGMKDTGFFVTKERAARFATLYVTDARNNLIVAAEARNASVTNYATKPSLPSGGGGLVSTARDYVRFSQMLLNKGALDGVRILAPATVQLMTSNHLTPSLMIGEFPVPSGKMRPGIGWGYDCAVVSDPLQADEVVGKGTFFWIGASGTWFWVDPTNDLIFVGMTQRMLGSGWPDMEMLTRPGIYQALLNPQM